LVKHSQTRGILPSQHHIPAFIAGPQEDENQVPEPAHNSRIPEFSSHGRLLRTTASGNEFGDEVGHARRQAAD
jgi:hypothetical protein